MVHNQVKGPSPKRCFHEPQQTDTNQVSVCSVVISPSESFLHGGGSPVISVDSAGHALHVFVNGQLAGDTHSLFLLYYTKLHQYLWIMEILIM